MREPRPGDDDALGGDSGPELGEARTHDLPDLLAWNDEVDDGGLSCGGAGDLWRIEHDSPPRSQRRMGPLEIDTPLARCLGSAVPNASSHALFVALARPGVVRDGTGRGIGYGVPALRDRDGSSHGYDGPFAGHPAPAALRALAPRLAGRERLLYLDNLRPLLTGLGIC